MVACVQSAHYDPTAPSPLAFGLPTSQLSLQNYNESQTDTLGTEDGLLQNTCKIASRRSGNQG
jgi:hypothetical protein